MAKYYQKSITPKNAGKSLHNFYISRTKLAAIKDIFKTKDLQCNRNARIIIPDVGAPPTSYQPYSYLGK